MSGRLIVERQLYERLKHLGLPDLEPPDPNNPDTGYIRLGNWMLYYSAEYGISLSHDKHGFLARGYDLNELAITALQIINGHLEATGELLEDLEDQR